MKFRISNLSKIFLHFLQNDALIRRFGLYLSIAAALCGIATYVVLTTSHIFIDKTQKILPLIYLDLTLLLLLAVIITKRLVELWSERRRKQAGSRLHVQIVGLFAFVSITPAICVAVFSGLFLNSGIEAWFGDPVRSALNEAQAVSQAYENEHKKSIKHDAIIIVGHLIPQINFLCDNPEILGDILSDFSDDRNLSELMVIKGNGQIIARSQFTFAIEFEKIFKKYIERAYDEKHIALLESDNSDRVRAILKIDHETDTYLYIGKLIDKAVLNHVTKTRGAIDEYSRLEEQRSQIHITFVALFMVVALLLLLAAIWGGLSVANLFARPIVHLIEAADRISEGNLSVQVPTVPGTPNELSHLSEAFNKMTSQLNNQRKNLIKANTQIDQRRHFMETVLTRISAGVITVDQKGTLYLINEKAYNLLSPNHNIEKRSNLQTVSPELYALLMEAHGTDCEIIHRHINVVRQGVSKIVQASVILDQSMENTIGYIITFDDITALMYAQRKAAWSDVARRIAHEIKNPLTPIQLSAERLKRRYLDEITSDKNTFQNCIDTIIRQVGSIGKLINEFSSFARMPTPVMQEHNLSDICRQALFLQKQVHLNFDFILNLPSAPVILNCDAGQIEQVLTNLLQNAINALTLNPESLSPGKSPKIVITLASNSLICLTVEDNGPGLPLEGRERLIEPYYTTHSKGTGLGLAIVAKIIEDHRGTLELGNSQFGGAKITINFSVASKR